MMTRWFPLVLLAVAVLALPGVAAAKGPSEARIDGPGLASPLVLTGGGEDGTGPLGALTLEGGFFATTFGQVPDARLRGRPPGDLGPRYSVDYTVPAGDTEPSHVQQDLYPYASGGPVLYLAPAQTIFNGGEITVGGWIRGPDTLLTALVGAGLPETAPGGGWGIDLGDPALLVGLAVVLLIAGGGLALLVRHRGGRRELSRESERGPASA
jgi:hypothetical protein